MGCGGDAQYGAPIKILYASGNVVVGEVHNRYSLSCLAQWERTLNLSGVSRYAEGNIRWGGANYNSGWQTVHSPEPISSGQQVYTPMYGTDAGIGPSLNCGDLSVTGPIHPPYPPPGYPLAGSPYYQNNCQARS